jgi:hypothetical protein
MQNNKTFTFETSQDREGNEIHRVSVCLGGSVIASEDFYSKDDAEAWASAVHPDAAEGIFVEEGDEGEIDATVDALDESEFDGDNMSLFLPWVHNDNGLINGHRGPEEECFRKFGPDYEDQNYPSICDFSQGFGIAEGPGDMRRAEYATGAANLVANIARTMYDGPTYAMDPERAAHELSLLIQHCRALVDGQTMDMPGPKSDLKAYSPQPRTPTKGCVPISVIQEARDQLLQQEVNKNSSGVVHYEVEARASDSVEIAAGEALAAPEDDLHLDYWEGEIAASIEGVAAWMGKADGDAETVEELQAFERICAAARAYQNLTRKL